MRRALLFSPALVLLLAAALASCGGSSSETPPPLEPDPATLGLGPAGEALAPATIVEEGRDGGKRKSP
jgi:hypothetical protein